MRKWLPVFEAFEAGAFMLWLHRTKFSVAVHPEVVLDGARRLHSANGPAFTWLDDIREYYWHDVAVPAAWIIDPASLTADTALLEPNIERRRAACDILGWDKILTTLGGKIIDRDGDPQIGTLVEVKLPGGHRDQIVARYLRVRCGTGRMFAVCVPPATSTAIEAQAWMLGLSPAQFVLPELRT